MDLSALLHPLPEVTRRKRFKASRIFTVEEMDLKFSNGTKATYEKIVGGRGAVMAVPFDGQYFYLSVEYAGGLESYQLGLVKGKVDSGETPEKAVVRELSEEISLGARKVTPLKLGMTVAPGMLELTMYVYLCEELYPCKQEGDEPEPIEIVKVTVQELKELLFSEDSPLKEARSIAALTLAMHKIGAL